MASSIDLAEFAERILSSPGALSANVPVLVRRKGEPANDIEAQIAKQSICLWVMPVFPTSAIEGIEAVVFDEAELRIRILEQVKLNRLPVTAYDLVDEIAKALHWQPYKGITAAVASVMVAQSVSQAAAEAIVQADPQYADLVALTAILEHPIYIAGRPVEQVEDDKTRIIDVIFKAKFQIQV